MGLLPQLQSVLLESTLGAVVMLRMDGANSQPSSRISSVYSASSRSTSEMERSVEIQVASQPCRLVCKNCRHSRTCSPLDSLLSNGGSSGCGTCAQYSPGARKSLSAGHSPRQSNAIWEQKACVREVSAGRMSAESSLEYTCFVRGCPRPLKQ